MGNSASLSIGETISTMSTKPRIRNGTGHEQLIGAPPAKATAITETLSGRGPFLSGRSPKGCGASWLPHKRTGILALATSIITEQREATGSQGNFRKMASASGGTAIAASTAAGNENVIAERGAAATEEISIGSHFGKAQKQPHRLIKEV